MFFEDADYFNEGLAFAKRGDKWGYIDQSGEFVIEPKFDGSMESYFSEGFATVRVGDRWAVINRRGEFVVEPILGYALAFKNGLACVADTSDMAKRGYINYRGEWVWKPAK